MELITESEKSKDHGTKKTDQTMEPSKTVDDDSDIEVEDLCWSSRQQNIEKSKICMLTC